MSAIALRGIEPQSVRALVALTGAGLRGYGRDRAALMWTLGFPAGLLALFTVLFSGGPGAGTGSFVPAILAMALMQLGLYGAVSLVQQRERGILKSLATAPIERWTVVGSFVLGRLVVALAQSVLLVAAASAISGVSFATLPAVLAVAALTSATFIALGFVVAAFSRTEEMATQLTSFLSLPLLFMSGLFIPVDQLPDFLRPIAAALPLTYASEALRQVMLGAASATSIWLAAAALAAWLGLSLVLATRRFRWQ